MSLVDRVREFIRPYGPMNEEPDPPTLLRIQNVADYAAQQEWGDYVKVLPNLAPPWRCALASYHLHEFGNAEVVILAQQHLANRTSLPSMRWVLVLDSFINLRTSVLRTLTLLSVDSKGAHARLDSLSAIEFRGLGIEWNTRFKGQRPPESYNWASGYTCNGVFVAEDLVSDPGPEFTYDVIRDLMEGLEMVNQLAIRPILMAYCFANCKNVSLVEERPCRAERRRAARNGGPPAETWHTLVIDGMKRELKAARNPDGSQPTIKQALHICRGHFKTYTNEHPFFGTRVGTWWWPMQTRGSAEVGVRHKDYEIKTGADS